MPTPTFRCPQCSAPSAIYATYLTKRYRRCRSGHRFATYRDAPNLPETLYLAPPRNEIYGFGQIPIGGFKLIPVQPGLSHRAMRNRVVSAYHSWRARHDIRLRTFNLPIGILIYREA